MAKIDLDVKVGPRGVILAAAGFVFAALVSEVSSESLNLTTFYPSPAGVYQSMLTAGMTYLSRDARGVTVGSTQGVQGRGRLVVPSGTVGINTLDPVTDLHVEGNLTFGDVGADQPKGITWGTNPNAGYGGTAVNGTGFKYGITREPGGWAYPTYSSLKFEWIEGIKIRAHAGYVVNDGVSNLYGGVSIWEDWCETGQTSCGAGGSGVGTEIARFRAQVYGGTYYKSRLGIGLTPWAPLDVGRDGVAVFAQSRESARVPTSGGCPPGHVATTQSGVITSSRGGIGGLFSLVCARCPDANCAGMP